MIMRHDARLELSVGPNPCKTEGIVKFSSDFSDNVSLKLTNLNGQLIKEFYKNHAEANVEYYIPVNVSHLKSGVYLVVMNIGNQVKASKLVKN